MAVDATVSTATNTGTVTSYIANNTTLSIGSAINVTATNDTDQLAVANSDAFGLIAGGGNSADAESTVQTLAYMGTGVTVTAGTAIGGLTDGGVDHIVLDDTMPVDPATAISGDEINLGMETGLQTGDKVVLIPPAVTAAATPTRP